MWWAHRDTSMLVGVSSDDGWPSVPDGSHMVEHTFSFVIDTFLAKHPHGTHYTLFLAYSLSMFLFLIMHTHTHKHTHILFLG